MRDVEVVKEKRNQLRDELSVYVEVRFEKYPNARNYKELGYYEKREYSYLCKCIDSLRKQINALEFVLNEDTEILDFTIPSMLEVEMGIVKKDVLNER